MFDTPPISIDKFVHSFLQNLGVNAKRFCHESWEKINFISQIDKSFKTGRKLLINNEEIKNIPLQSDLNLSEIKDIKHFIERQTNFSDKLVYFKNDLLLVPHIEKINKKIVQKVNKVIMQNEQKPKKSLLQKCRKENYSKEHKENLSNSHKKSHKSVKFAPSSSVPSKENYCIDSTVFQKGKEGKHNILKGALKEKSNLFPKKRKYNRDKHSLSINMAKNMEKETKLNEKYLELYIKDADFIKRNVHITLYIAFKQLRNHPGITKINHQQVSSLCKQAILSLIEPSKNAFVLFENNLFAIIENYLSHGYDYHFDISGYRNAKDYYIALLVLSQWAKFLMRHPDITMIQTICHILGCKRNKILILHQPDDN